MLQEWTCGKCGRICNALIVRCPKCTAWRDQQTGALQVAVNRIMHELYSTDDYVSPRAWFKEMESEAERMRNE